MSQYFGGDSPIQKANTAIDLNSNKLTLLCANNHFYIKN